MMPMPTKTPGVVHLLAGSKDKALQRTTTSITLLQLGGDDLQLGGDDDDMIRLRSCG